MGFFDEDDDDDDDDTDEEPKQSSLSHNVDGTSSAGIIDDGAEDDPLDAYMKELAQHDQELLPNGDDSGAKDTNLRRKRLGTTRTRMDLNEEEEEDDDDDDACVHIISRPFGQERTHYGAERDDEEDHKSRPRLASHHHHHDEHEEPARPPPQQLSMLFVKGKTQGDDYYERHNSSLCVAQAPANPSFLRKNLFTPQSTAMGAEWRRVHNATLVPIRQQRQYDSSISSSSSSNNNNHHHHSVSVDPILQFLDVQPILGPNLYERLLVDYPTPTPVQSQTLPVTLSGKDALVTAATGQGKTLMYLLSVLSHIRHFHSSIETTGGGGTSAAGFAVAAGPSALVLCPTRELALQVQSTVQPLANACRVTSRAVIGGQNKFTLWQELKRTRLDLVIATPGRLLDVVSDKKGFGLRSVGFVVLDEADKMLQMGFDVQVRNILRQVPMNRQTLMLSATMGNKVGVLASDLLQRDAVRISVGRTGESSHHVQQHVMVLPDEAAKEAFMVEMVPVFLPLGRCIVFVATKEKCEYIAKLLRDQTALSASKSSTELMILTLHGDRHQSDRTAAVRAFRRGDCKLLIATDVASRGLDVPNVQTIVSFDPAKTLDAHVHRVGRAGRLSNNALDGGQMTGSAYTLLTKANTDFAIVLRNSFQREERPISEELEALAQRSRRAGSGTVDMRKGGNKQGLGFTADAGHFYGSQEADPPMKKSRWR